MKTKQTAVEWLLQQVNRKGWGNYMIDIPKEIIEQAKQMEKQQVVNAWKDAEGYNDTDATKHGEKYYNETYGN
jgi:hypothetical protein